MKKILALILALVMCFSLVACGGEKDDAKTDDKPAASQGTDKKEDKPASNPANEDLDPIKIGILIPLSGGSATSGVTMKYVADMIADEINNELGGIQNFGGRPIELVYGDTQSDATVSAAEFERLMEEGCVAYIGGYNSPISQSLAPQVIANDQIMIMVNAYANAAYTTPNDNVWHVSGCAATSEITNKEFKDWQRETLEGYKGGEVYGYIYTASDYGRDAYEQLLATAEANGVKEIVGVPVESGVSDLSSVLMKLKERDDIEYLSCAIPMADAILFIRQCQQYDVTVPIFAGGSGFCWADILDQIGESSDYLYTTGTHFFDAYRTSYDPDLAYEYGMKCKEAIGWVPDENYACMWGDLWTLWDALERAKSLEVADIKTALRETNITGEHKALLMTVHESITLPESFTGEITGTVVYNQNPDYTSLWAMSKDGMYRIVYPEHMADPNYPVTYPVPSWADR